MMEAWSGFSKRPAGAGPVGMGRVRRNLAGSGAWAWVDGKWQHGRWEIWNPHPGPTAIELSHLSKLIVCILSLSSSGGEGQGAPRPSPIRWESEVERGARRNPGRRSFLAGPGLFSFILSGFRFEPARDRTAPGIEVDAKLADCK